MGQSRAGLNCDTSLPDGRVTKGLVGVEGLHIMVYKGSIWCGRTSRDTLFALGLNGVSLTHWLACKGPQWCSRTTPYSLKGNSLM